MRRLTSKVSQLRQVIDAGKEVPRPACAAKLVCIQRNRVGKRRKQRVRSSLPARQQARAHSERPGRIVGTQGLHDERFAMRWYRRSGVSFARGANHLQERQRDERHVPGDDQNSRTARDAERRFQAGERTKPRQRIRHDWQRREPLGRARIIADDQL